MEHKIRQGMAGHTMTLVNGRRKLLVIGGISGEGDFSDSLLEYDLERDWWMRRSDIGGGISVYGHSAVYHEGSESVYVFGGVAEGLNTSTGMELSKFYPGN